ncbi:MAG: hypothetical protein CTY29_04305 [Methylobacter sp.]|nr:MAG: hypothetical protein CTY29_04305 [Methylobacter sp.]
MSQELGNAYAEIRYLNQENYAGSGFLINGDYIVTCTHVLLEALGSQILVSGMEIRVDFRYLDLKNVIMEVVHFYPVIEENNTKNQLEDMALLGFKEGKPQSIGLPKVEFPDFNNQDNHPIRIYSHKLNDFVAAKNKSHSPEGWLILDTDITVEKGDSGTPIWNEKIQAITGMLVARQRNKLTCYAIPTIKIFEAFKEHLTPIDGKSYSEFEQEDESFLKKVEQSILNDLARSNLFRENLASECMLDSSASKKVVGFLIEQCRCGKFDDIVRQNQAVLNQSWDEVNKDKSYEVEALFKASTGVVAKLALYNVDIRFVARSIRTHPVLELPKINLSPLEVFISRYSRTIPTPKQTNTGIKGVNRMGNIFALEHGIQKQDAVISILKALATSFLCYQIDEIDKQQWTSDYKKQLGDEISKTINYRKKHTDIELKQSCFVLLPSDGSSALLDPDVQEEITKLVPNLEWVTFKSGNYQQVFIIDDTLLMIALRDYYSTLDKLVLEWTNTYKK